jgi:hypothetical protein
MKVYGLSVLCVAGIILLSGSVFSNDLQWKKPGNSAPASSVTNIPTIITTDDEEPLRIAQVQQSVPSLPRMAPPAGAQLDRDDNPAVWLQGQNPPSGASTRYVAPIPPRNQQVHTERNVVACDDLIGLKSIKDISHDIRMQGTELPPECVINSEPFDGRHFSQTCYMWKASALSTRGAYFEDTQLERYGHTKVCPILQPVVSGAKFFATVPILPYKMGVTPPNECVYTLGHHRPGNCAPYMREPFPISVRGALFQAGAVAGGIAVFP